MTWATTRPLDAAVQVETSDVRRIAVRLTGETGDRTHSATFLAWSLDHMMQRDDNSLHVEKLGAGTRDLIKHDTRLGTLLFHIKDLTNGPMLYPVDHVRCFGQMEVMSIGCLVTYVVGCVLTSV